MSRWRSLTLIVLAAPLVCLAALWGAFALAAPDSASVVVRNVRLADTAIGGANSSSASETIEELADALPATPVTITTPEFTLETTAGDLGVRVDEEATLAAALAVGRNDPGPLAPVRWFKSLFRERPVPLQLRIDRAKADTALAELEGEHRAKPVEPTLSTTDDAVGMSPGTPGRALDVDDVLEQVPLHASLVGEPITISTEQRSIDPRFTDAEVTALAERAMAITSKPFTLRIGETGIDLDSAEFRTAFRVGEVDDRPALALDAAMAKDVITRKLPVQPNPTGVRFDIVNGVPVPVAGADAEVCCAEDTPQRITDALLAGESGLELTTMTMTAQQGAEWAQTLGVKEVVGEFTTKHPCCAPRVQNIHRISDLTRGVLIAPGETFSANDFVGRRTAEKGFVSAPVIEDGEFKEDFGGGVSQWATTMFNAAFFAGLDIPVHKAHSIYISRYPYGREATLAFPSVDLKIRNNTPYGVVIWPTYTNNSITVQLWSTRYAVGAQTDVTSSKPNCGSVKVKRTTTFVSDGRTEDDTFVASYDCDPPKH